MVTLAAHPDFVLSNDPTDRFFALWQEGQCWGVIVDSDIASDPSSPKLGDALRALSATRIVVAHARPSVEDGRPALAWTRASVEGLHAACRRWLGAIDPGATLLLWPRADQIVSDIPSAWSLLRTLETERLGLVLDPDAMITPSMREHREDHLRRLAEALGTQPRTAMVIDRGSLPTDFAPHLPRFRQPGVSGDTYGT